MQLQQLHSITTLINKVTVHIYIIVTQ